MSDSCLNFPGSLADRNMNFSSTVSTEEATNVQPFNNLSVYIPSYAADNVIKGYNGYAYALSSTQPIVIAVDKTNYEDVMQNDLLMQYQEMFNEGTNSALTIYLVVFYCPVGSSVTFPAARAVRYEPLERAFEKLYFISYYKTLYDPNMDGTGFSYISSGLKSRLPLLFNNSKKTCGYVNITVTNSGGSAADIAAGQYVFTSGSDPNTITYYLDLEAPISIAASGSMNFSIYCNTAANLPLSATTPTITAQTGSPFASLTIAATGVASRGGIATDAVISAGEYSYTCGGHDYTITLNSTYVIGAGGSVEVFAVANTAGQISQPSSATIQATSVPVLDDGTLFGGAGDSAYTQAFVAVNPGTSTYDGGADAGSTVTIPSGYSGENKNLYFDLSLALANCCRADKKLSMFLSTVRLTLSGTAFPGNGAMSTDPNYCKIRSKTVGEEEAAMVSLTAGHSARAAYYWQALKLLGCSNSVFLTAVSCTETEASVSTVGIWGTVFSLWFSKTNSSGQYVGNKLHLIRMQNKKPFGYPSTISQEVNLNDEDAPLYLGAKHVAYLQSISANADDSCLTESRTIGGTSVNALMISKWVDYQNSMECADMITDKGTLTNPIITNEEAYTRIQNVVYNNLNKFVGNRLSSIKLTFPPFKTAKTGLTSLEAASAWSAVYTDDLDTITVTGSVAEYV